MKDAGVCQGQEIGGYHFLCFAMRGAVIDIGIRKLPVAIVAGYIGSSYKTGKLSSLFSGPSISKCLNTHFGRSLSSYELQKSGDILSGKSIEVIPRKSSIIFVWQFPVSLSLFVVNNFCWLRPRLSGSAKGRFSFFPQS